MTIIDDKHRSLREAGLDLGPPIHEERTLPDGGQFRAFSHVHGEAYIYFHARIGEAHEVHGAIAQLWNTLGRQASSFGFPISDEQDTPHSSPAHPARVSFFEHGEIYWAPGHGAYEVFPAPPPVMGPREEFGVWQVPAYRSGVVGVHIALLHTGRVLLFSYRDPGPHTPSAPELHGDSAVLDVRTGAISHHPIGAEEMNLFCSGQALLADGRVLVGGGERETGRNVFGLHTFEPDRTSGGTWRKLGELSAGRWYPTCATLPDGGVLIMVGNSIHGPNWTFEIYHPARGLQPPVPIGFTEEGHSTYPFVLVLPNNKVLMHLGWHSRFLDLATLRFDDSVVESAPRPNRNSRTYGNQGTAVLLPLSPDSTPPYCARVMMIGGAGAPPASIRTPATNTCEILDLADDPPRWRLAAPMSQPRVMPDSVLLPTGKVLVMNGSSTGKADAGANPVYAVELYDPDGDTWTSMASMAVPRLYHSTALLLPDGRVMTAGSDSAWNPDPFHSSELRVEILSPPYLFRGERPVIEGAPSEISYGSQFDVVTPARDDIASVAFIRCGSVTHSFNSDQRYVALRIAERRTTPRLRWEWRPAPIGNRPIKVPVFRNVPSLRLDAPPNGAVAPPGYYMLFIVNASGVPSEAKFVRLDRYRFRFPFVERLLDFIRPPRPS